MPGCISKLAGWLACALSAATCLAAEPVVSLDPGTQQITPGSTFSVDLVISGLGSGVALGAFDIDVGFDGALLAGVAATFGDQLDLFGLGDLQGVTLSDGKVGLFEISLESSSDLVNLQSASFRLATITFESLGSAGTTPLTLALNSLGDADGAPLAAALQGAEVTIAAVPEPQPWLLVALGLPVVAGAARRIARRR